MVVSFPAAFPWQCCSPWPAPYRLASAATLQGEAVQHPTTSNKLLPASPGLQEGPGQNPTSGSTLPNSLPEDKGGQAEEEEAATASPRQSRIVEALMLSSQPNFYDGSSLTSSLTSFNSQQNTGPLKLQASSWAQTRSLTAHMMKAGQGSGAHSVSARAPHLGSCHEGGGYEGLPRSAGWHGSGGTRSEEFGSQSCESFAVQCGHRDGVR